MNRPGKFQHKTALDFARGALMESLRREVDGIG
jgi:hypothetical protein